MQLEEIIQRNLYTSYPVSPNVSILQNYNRMSQLGYMILIQLSNVTHFSPVLLVVCMCVCVFSSVQFYHVWVHVFTTSYDTEPLNHHKDPSCSPFITTSPRYHSPTHPDFNPCLPIVSCLYNFVISKMLCR